MGAFLDKLETAAIRLEELKKKIIDPNILADVKLFAKISKEYSDLKKVVEIRSEYKRILACLSEAQTILSEDSDTLLCELAKGEIEKYAGLIPKLEEEIKLLITPIDSQDQKNAIIEIRSGTGGDEAALFVGDLFRMYLKYCEFKGWKTHLTNSSESPSGGFKEVVFNVEGKNAYGNLKYESGVHRVQRIPKTETQGRIHTSAATVATFSEVEEIDIDLKESDIRTDTFCSSGPGGQSVNTTYSAIRLTHLPTGIIVQCQDERSQLKNKKKALTELRSRIYQRECQQQMKEIALKRRIMVSSGDRSAKIRTYNYHQGRVTDHRINYTINYLSSFLEGDIQKMIDQLILVDHTEQLKEKQI